MNILLHVINIVNCGWYKVLYRLMYIFRQKSPARVRKLKQKVKVSTKLKRKARVVAINLVHADGDGGEENNANTVNHNAMFIRKSNEEFNIWECTWYLFINEFCTIHIFFLLGMRKMRS